jgi:ABC-2 type transport system ATP-binding protein
VSAAIEISQLRKSYDGVTVIDGLDLAVERGEIFALLGPNGAGKTTTVEICEGFRRADGGRVAVLDTDPRRASAHWRSRIGIVAQQTTDFEDVTVAEAVDIVAGLFLRPRPPAAVIDAVGLTEYRNVRGSKLSGGLRRRLDVALGIVGDPELLFLDEPTTGFDPESRRQFWELIRGLNESGTTILLTTHYLDEAEHLARRVGVIAAGRVLEIGSPAVIGGRDEAEAMVRWVAEDSLHEERTATPTALIASLQVHFGGEIPGLVVERPTLEDVYVRMIERVNQSQAAAREARS